MTTMTLKTGFAPAETSKCAGVTVTLAPLTDLLEYRPKFLAGRLLKKVKRVQKSIQAFGMMTPVVLRRTKKGLSLVDGHKRVAALSRLSVKGALPRTLTKVPCIIVDPGQPCALDFDETLMTSNSELHRHVERLTTAGYSQNQVSKALFVPLPTVDALCKVSGLSPRLKAMFHRDLLSLGQIRALTTITNPKLQDSVMDALGPFAESHDIMREIAQGAKVVALGDDDALILPSDNPPLKAKDTLCWKYQDYRIAA